METSLKILETKLASIDWLRSAQQGNVPNLPSIQDLQETEFKDDIKVPSNDIPAPKGNNTNPNNNNNPSNNIDNNNDNNGVPVPPEQPAVDPLLEDEDMKPWFRMLKFGVPEQGARNKMAQAGLDQDTIDRIVAIHKSR
eukprot:CAMPEP_0114664648 /NCGR_PEP_ID=MMETSP0191-20121206/29198_1 /TAXON_ID=126664 /ORGANISM="Sorites sp." /LENGTH=138 /DNA_ID=CAMNT_0001907361 /DNA_START=339 /DNA_END=755 /DNA_ORIENTATION=-